MDHVDAVVEEMQSLGVRETQTERLSRKLRDNPFLGHGLLALATVAAVGAYGFKRRATPTGLYLMQLRVLSQGALVASLAAGLGLNILRNSRPKLAVQPKVVWW